MVSIGKPVNNSIDLPPPDVNNAMQHQTFSGGIMPWHQIILEGSTIGDISARSLINDFQRAFLAAGAPSGVRIFRTTTRTGNHIYFFSPEASAIAGTVLDSFHATPCPATPDLDASVQIRLQAP